MRNPKSGGGNAMVAHYSGTTLGKLAFCLLPPLCHRASSYETDLATSPPTDAQIRYADGAISILDNWLNGKAQLPANVIVENGEYATKAYGQREKK